MRRWVAALAVAALAGGCGSSAGLHLENGGHTVAVTNVATSQPGSSNGSPLPRRVTARVELGGRAAIAWDGAHTMWAAVWAGGPHLLGSLVPVDTDSGRPGAALPLPPSPSPYLVAVGAGSVYAAAGDRVLRIDPATGTVLASSGAGGTVRALLFAQGSLWACVDHGPLDQLDPSTLHARALHPTDSPDAITTLAASVLLTDDDQRVLQRVAIRSGRVAESTPVGTSDTGPPSQITVYAGSIWIYEGTRVVQVSPNRLRLLNSVTTPSAGGTIAAGTGLASSGDAVWVVQRRTGALLRLSP